MNTKVGYIAEDEKEEVCLAFLPEVMNKLGSCSSFITLPTTTENTTNEVLPTTTENTANEVLPTTTQSSTSTIPTNEDISETPDISQYEKMQEINDHKETAQNDVKIEEMNAYNVATNAHFYSWNFCVSIIFVLSTLGK